jgi:hypothetical protein
MKTVTRISAMTMVALLALAIAAPAVLAAKGTRFALHAAKAFPAAKGSAQFSAKAGERELQVEVEHVRRLAGKTLSVSVGGSKIGTMRVSALGAAELHRVGAVPAVGPRTAVAVRTASGAIVASR